MKRVTGLTLVAAICLLAAACGGSSGKGSASATKVGGKLVIDNASGSTWTCQFNPFNSAVTLTAFGFFYEPLEEVDILNNAQTTPWLATSAQWSDHFRSLTVTTRPGATWSDGKPFTAADVAYTFNAMKSDKAIDANALWPSEGGPLTSVTAKGTNQVVFRFNAAAQPYGWYVVNQTPIIPEHIWGALNQSKLHSYADTKPVGTGPYVLSGCTSQNIKYVRNTHYWQSTPGHPVPAVEEVDYPAFLSNTPANLTLAQGQAQWGGQYIPNLQSFYVAKDPAHRHYWFPPVANVSLVPNLNDAQLSKLAVRQALAYAIDRAAVARLGESGYQQAANQTGVINPTYQRWYDSSLPQPSYDPAKAEQILKSAGYTKGADGIFHDASGNRLSFTIKTITGFSDWDSSLQVITQELKAAGIAVTVQDENSGPYTTDLQGGHFQLAYAGSGGPGTITGPTPYYELRGLLFSGNIGSSNYSHFKSAAADALFNQYPAATQPQQLQILHQVEKIMVDDIPIIPMTEGVDWYQYDTTNFTGWPTQTNPFAQPSPYQFPDLGLVLTRLKPTA